MKNKKIFLFILLIIFILILSIIFSILNFGNTKIFSKILIDNINVSNKSKDEANSELSNLVNAKKHSKINLKYTASDSSDNYEMLLDLSTLDLEYDISSSISEGYNYGRTGNIFQNNFAIAKALFFGKNFSSNITYNEKTIQNIISDISANLPGKLVQSGYYIDNGNLIITKGSSGIIVDEDNFIKNLLSELNNLSSTDSSLEIPVKTISPYNIDIDQIHSEIYKKASDAYFETEPFKIYSEVVGVDFDVNYAKKLLSENANDSEYSISLKYTKPKVTLDDLKIDVFPDLLGTFSTRYDASNKNRSTNLNLAASKINNIVLAPGEEFSYNKIVGERSIKAGYKESKIYSGGKVVDGLGGGICQISSTLYNAVMFANLDVTKRYNHQFITSYVEPGRDATVAYGAKDFKFKNNRTCPIKIKISINSGIAKVDIYGIKEDPEYDISFDIETVDVIPYKTEYKTNSSLSADTEQVTQKGVNGIIVKVYKVTKQNGVTISKDFIYKDKYNAIDEVITKSSK